MSLLEEHPLLSESNTGGGGKGVVSRNGMGKGAGSGRLKDFIILVQFVFIVYLFSI